MFIDFDNCQFAEYGIIVNNCMIIVAPNELKKKL